MLAPKPKIYSLNTKRRAFSTSTTPPLREAAVTFLHRLYLIHQIEDETGSQRLTTLRKKIANFETKQFISVSNDPEKNQLLIESGGASKELLGTDKIATI